MSRLITCGRGWTARPDAGALHWPSFLFLSWGIFSLCMEARGFASIGRYFSTQGGSRSNDRPHARRHAGTRARVRAFTGLRLKTLKTFSCFSAH